MLSFTDAEIKEINSFHERCYGLPDHFDHAMNLWLVFKGHRSACCPMSLSNENIDKLQKLFPEFYITSFVYKWNNDRPILKLFHINRFIDTSHDDVYDIVMFSIPSSRPI